MALGNATFTDISSGINAIGAAAQDIFQSEAQAGNLQLQATGTRISAEGTQLEAEGDTTEASNYTLAGTLAEQNAQYTAQNTQLQETMANRQIYQGLSTTQAGVAGSGFQDSGSGFYLMKEGAMQGALQKGLLANQGSITEAGYTEQATSYENLAQYATTAATTETSIAGQQEQLANSQDALASQIESAGQTAADFSYASAAVSGIAALATLAL